jgi:sorting nexin-29
LTVDPIELDELEEILKSFKNKKSPGNDGMNIELLKYTPVEIKVRFLHIINIYWNMHKIPYERTRGVIFPVFKKGNRWDCNNYRGISLLNVAYKVYAKIITRRLNIINKYTLSKEQCGFHKGCTCSDCIFII